MNSKLIHPINIDGLTIANNIYLAPLAGGSNLAFRRIAREQGSGLVTTELVSARGINYSGSTDSSFRYLEISEAEQPVAIQLFGFEANDFERAIELILADERLNTVAMIDINMGCPVPKVVKTGAGSALMQRPDEASAIVRACRRALAGTGKPLSVKIRQGFKAGENNAAEFARRLVDSGAQMITVHARTRDQMYSGQANWPVIREVVEAIGRTVPVFGNGDVVDTQSAKQLFRETDCAGLMIGRAALGNPWIFARIMSELNGEAWEEPTLEERFAVIRQHYTDLTNQVGADVGAREMRKALVEYVKHQPEAAALRRLATQVSKQADFEIFLATWQDAVSSYLMR